MKIEVIHGKSEEVLKTLEDNSVDSIVTDPPYELGFMGKEWDNTGIAYNVDLWRECLRVLKPGGHLLAFGGTRTYHRMACAIEDAGFEIRDQIQWIYGSGFPKSMNIGKAVDNSLGLKRTNPIGVKVGHEDFANRGNKSSVQSLKGTLGGEGGFSRPWMDDDEAIERYHTQYAPESEQAKQWEGFGTALKPANEPICMARKPLSEKTVALNVLKWGTGGINIDGCRVETVPDKSAWLTNRKTSKTFHGDLVDNEMKHDAYVENQGRFPANVIHDGSEEVLERFPYSTSGAMDSISKGKNYGIYGKYNGKHVTAKASEGSASRFFYCAKASKSERNKGCEDLNDKHFQMRPFAEEGCDMSVLKNRMNAKTGKNNHPTVKPVSLMRYLCRLITPPKGIVLDPFTGSGTTGIGAKVEGFSFIGIENEQEYCEIARARIDAWEEEKPAKEQIKNLTLFDL